MAFVGRAHPEADVRLQGGGYGCSIYLLIAVGLAKLVRDSKTTPWQLPTNVLIGAAYATTAALDAALISDLYLAISAQGVDADRAEAEARLMLTARADLVLLDPEVRVLLIDKVL